MSFILNPSRFIVGAGGGGHRYWRVIGRVAGTYDGGALTEVEFYDTVGGSNIATGGTPIGGTEAFGGTHEQAFDGDKTTSFYAGSGAAVPLGGSWVGYDFGAGNEPDVVQFELTARAGSNSNQIWDEWDLDYSDDGSSWTTVNSYVDTSSWGSNESRKYLA